MRVSSQYNLISKHASLGANIIILQSLTFRSSEHLSIFCRLVHGEIL